MFDFFEECFEDERELCAVHYEEWFDNYYSIMMDGTKQYEIRKNDVLVRRKKNELHFHNFLEHQLFSRLQEIKYYSNVNIFDTRRLVATSADCISMVQLLVRDQIHLMVHFRSSDFDGALPVDLEWISTLPHKLIRHLSKMQGVKGYEEINPETIKSFATKPIKLDLTFGSLHRTN